MQQLCNSMTLRAATLLRLGMGYSLGLAACVYGVVATNIAIPTKVVVAASGALCFSEAARAFDRRWLLMQASKIVELPETEPVQLWTIFRHVHPHDQYLMHALLTNKLQS
jgi:hypothetical protein